MKITTFKTVTGRTLVSGLLWQPISGAEKTFKSEVALLGGQLGCDLAVIRKGGVNQVGYASSSDGVKAGWGSLAAIVSKSIEIEFSESSFLCATILPDGQWFYLAQRDGSIIPDADFIGAEIEVKSRILSDFSLAAWDVIISPQSWGLPKSTERALISLLPATSDIKKYRIEHIKANYASIIKKAIIPSVVVAAIVVGGSFGYKKYQENIAHKAEVARAAAEAAAAAAAVVPDPWESQPSAHDFVKSCLDSLDKISLTPGGWSTDMAICDAQGLTISWTRPIYSTIKLLKTEAASAVIDVSGDKAVMTFPVKFGISQKEIVPNSEFARESILTKSQQVGVRVTLVEDMSIPPLPGSPEAISSTGWHEIKWSFSSKLSPKSMIDLFGGPGFRVQKMSLKVQSGSAEWSMEGIQYVKN